MAHPREGTIECPVAGCLDVFQTQSQLESHIATHYAAETEEAIQAPAGRPQNPYKVLGVKQDVSEKELRRAWIERSRKAHPDKVGEGDTDLANKQQQAINEAYELLSDPTRREQLASSMDEDDIDSNVDEEISGHIRAGGAAPSDALLRLMREAADSYDPATKSKLSEPPLILIQRKLAALKQTLRERAGQLELKHQCSVCSSTFTTMRLRVEHQEKQHPEFAIFLAECQKQLPPTLIELLEQFMQTSAQQAAQFAEEIGLAPSQLDALRSTVVPPAPADSPALPRPERAKGMRVGEKPSLRLNNPPPLPKLRPQRSDGDAFQCTKSQGWQNHRWHPSPASSALLPPCMPWPLDLAQAPRQEGGAKPGKCAVCGSSFGWFLWRHNCRGCAAVICANCSHTASLALLGYSAAKVCPTCYDVPPYQLSEEAVRQYVLNNRRRLTPQVFLDLQAARPFPTAVLRELAQHLQDSNVAVSMWMERAGGTLRNEWRNYWILCSSEAQRRDLVALCEFSRVELLEIARVELAAGRKTASWFYGSILADKAAWLHELTWLNEHAQGDVYSAFCRLIPVTFTLADLLPFLVPDRVKFAFDLRLTSPQQLELGRQLFLSASPAFAEWKDLNQASSSESTWIEWVRSECSSQPELALTFLLLVAKPPADLVWTLGLQLYQWKDEEARATWLRYAEDHLKPTDWSTFIAKPAQTLQEVELGVIALSRCSGDVPLDDFVERGRALLSKAPSLFPEWVGCFSKRTTPDWEKYARQFCGTAPHFAFRCLRCCENDSADFWFDWLLQCTKEGFYPVAKQILQSSPLQRTTAADWRTEAQRQLAKSNLAGALFCVAQQTEVSVLDWCLERNQHLLALYVDRKAFLAWTRQQAEAGTDKTPVLMLALESCTGDARLPMLLRCIDHLSQQQKAPSITRELTLFALSLQSSTVQKAKLITQQAKTLSQNSKPLELSALAYAESLLGGHLPDDAEIRRQTLVAEVKAELHQKQIAAAQPLLKLLGSMELTALVEKMLEHYYTDEMDAIYGFVRSLKSFITSKSSNLHRALMFFARGLGKLHELQVDGVRDVANAVYACPAPEIQAAVVSIFTDPLVRSICLLDDIRWLEELPDWNQEVRLSQRHFYAEAFASSKVVRRIVRHERAVASAQASPAERASFFWNVADDTIGPASEAQAYVLAAWQLATALSSEKDNSKFGHKTGCMVSCLKAAVRAQLLCPPTQVYIGRQLLQIYQLVRRSCPDNFFSDEDILVMEYVTRLLKNNSTLVPVQFSQILLSSDMLLLDRVNAEVFGRMLAEYKKHPFPLTSDADVYYSTLTGVWHSWLDLPKITEELSDDEGPAPGEEYEPSADVSIVLVDELELRKRKEAKEERRRAREEAKLLEQRLAALADCRLEAMSFFLASENIDFQIIQDNLQFSAEHRADDGYLSADRSRYGQGVYDQATLCGFTIALDSFDLELQTQTASAHRLGLFCQDDVNVAISNGAAAILFSLDQISADYPYHPFQKQRLAPASLAGTEIHQTLLHTDYLLKFLSTGVEPCGHAPFQLRAVEAGVLNRLPANLRRKLLTIHQVQGPAGGEQHRLWIEPVSELKYNLEQRDGKVYVQFGELKMGVRAKRLVPTTDGDLADAPADDEEESSSHAFAKLVTTYYAEFGQAFPEFLRLRELCKISAMVNIYQSIIFNAKPDHAGCRGFAQKIANDWKRIQAETGYPFSKVPSRSEVQSKIKVAQPQLYEARQKAQEVANALGSVLSNVQAEVDNSFESNVENAYRDVCRRANVRNLSWQEEREAKDLLRSRIRESADTQLANFRQQLINQQEDLPVYLRQQWLREGGSSSWVEGVAAYIHNRTTQQYDRLVDDSIGFIRVEMEKQNEALENVMIQRYSAVLTKSTVLALLKSTSTDWVTLAANETYNREYREWQRKQSRQEARHGLKLGMDLTFDHLPPRYWVPATYAISRSGAFLRRIYGGVNLQTQLLAAKQVAQPPPNSSFVMGTATVTCQLAHGSPYSPAVIQQNIQANNVAAANRVRVQVQVPSYTRGNGTVVPGYTRTQWVNPNGPSSNHGYEYKKARNDYLRNVVVNDPNVPTHVRAWVTQEIRNRGSGYLRSPPGFQVGHKVGAAVGGAHESSNFRMENQKDNEDRGRKFRR